MTVDDLLAVFADDAFVLVYGAAAGAAPRRVLQRGYSKPHLPQEPLTCPVPDCCGCGFNLHGAAHDIAPPVTRDGMTRQVVFVQCVGTVGAGPQETRPCERRVQLEIVGRLRQG